MTAGTPPSARPFYATTGCDRNHIIVSGMRTAKHCYAVGLTLLVAGGSLMPFTMVGMLGYLAVMVALAYLVGGIASTKSPEVRLPASIGGFAMGLMGALGLVYAAALAAVVGFHWGNGPVHGHLRSELDAGTELLYLLSAVLPAAVLAAAARLRGNWPARPSWILALCAFLSSPATAILCAALTPFLPTSA